MPRGTTRRRRWLPVTPPRQMGAAAIGVAGVLGATLAAANEDLHGAGFVLSVIVGTAAGLLIVEATHRAGVARAGLLVSGVCVGGAVIAVAVAHAPSEDAPVRATPTSTAPAPGGDVKVVKDPLRVTITPSDPGDFSVAFPDDIGLPAEDVGWRELIEQGGIDIHRSKFDLTLANRSDVPLTVTDIHAEIVSSDPAPKGSRAFAFTQGDGPLGQFAARFLDAAPGSTAALYDLLGGAPGWLADPPRKPFFDESYISLEPGEIYEGTITVETELPLEIGYRFVVAGSMPDRELVVEDRRVARISGLTDWDVANPKYERAYVAGYLAHQAGACPDVAVRRWYRVPPEGLLGACPQTRGPAASSN